MSHKSQFKWYRAVPPVDPARIPAFQNNWIKTMRQIPSLVGTVPADGMPHDIMTAWIPSNSWGNTKVVLIRGAYSLFVPPTAPIPGMNIVEDITSTQWGTAVLPTPAPFTMTNGNFTTYIERVLIRVDPHILIYDRGDTMLHSFANDFDAIAHVIPVSSAIGPDFDFTIEIPIHIRMTIPITAAGAITTCSWCEAMMEQPVNLGRLP